MTSATHTHGSRTASGSAADPTADAQAPHLLLHTGKGGSGSLSEYFAQDVDPAWGDAVLVLSCFITGLLDSAVFNIWGCFVSMQTGNTVYLSLGFASQPQSSPYRWLKSLVAIASFLLGSLAFASLSRVLGPLRRSFLVLSFLLQAFLVLIPALLSTVEVVPGDAGNLLPDDVIVLLPLALLSFQSAGQCVMSRALGFSELTTVVLTSAYADLMADPKLLARPISANPKRNRRVTGALFLLGGAIIGGFMTRGGRIQGVLWVAGGMKVAIALLWTGWLGQQGGGIRLP